ncbi:MAG: DUF4296 domain-containing protein [Alistipes sp.]|nr:DUF4296 domain-containing protein [Alistipes sp.]
MKRLIRMLLLSGAVALGACARERIISDSELARIFRDAYLINAYTADQSVLTDSLEIYEPVFRRYGYTTEDVRNTIANFSRRKSAKLSDVVEQSIALLEEENDRYKYEVGVLDTIDNIARRRYTRTLLADSLIRVGTLRDTARLRIRMEDIRPGEYAVSFSYLIDSLDDNRNVRALFWLEDAAGKHREESSNLLRRRMRSEIKRTLRADSSSRLLILELYRNGERLKRPDATFYGLEIRYTPTAEAAVDSLYTDQLNLSIFADEFFAAFAPDSLQSALHGAGDRQ